MGSNYGHSAIIIINRELANLMQSINKEFDVEDILSAEGIGWSTDDSRVFLSSDFLTEYVDQDYDVDKLSYIDVRDIEECKQLTDHLFDTILLDSIVHLVTNTTTWRNQTPDSDGVGDLDEARNQVSNILGKMLSGREDLINSGYRAVVSVYEAVVYDGDYELGYSEHFRKCLSEIWEDAMEDTGTGPVKEYDEWFKEFIDCDKVYEQFGTPLSFVDFVRDVPSSDAHRYFDLDGISTYYGDNSGIDKCMSAWKSLCDIGTHSVFTGRYELMMHGEPESLNYVEDIGYGVDRHSLLIDNSTLSKLISKFGFDRWDDVTLSLSGGTLQYCFNLLGRDNEPGSLDNVTGVIVTSLLEWIGTDLEESKQNTIKQFSEEIDTIRDQIEDDYRSVDWVSVCVDDITAFAISEYRFKDGEHILFTDRAEWDCPW